MAKLDKEACIGCGMCVSICEEVFEFDGTGKVRVKENKDVPCVKEAIENCPVNAITK